MSRPRAILVVGLAFGDCGKGSIVDFLARQYNAHTVVRFNGGPQAGHNVVTADGRHHTFSQFGSATFLPGVRTHLSRFMLIEPYALFNEANHLEQIGVPDAFDRLTIDSRCVVITPAHQAANRLRELARGDAAHGTCGMGVGETVQDLLERPDLAIRAGDLANRDEVARRLNATRQLKLEQLPDAIASLQSNSMARLSIETLRDPSWIEVAVENYCELAHRVSIVDESLARAVVSASGTTIFEGAQGVLLDETHGFHPHTTWTRTTFANADEVLDESGFTGRRTRMGVLRTYFTRHGPGPFVTEDSSLREHLPDAHNGDVGWQGEFRIGIFDAVAARYALCACGRVDALALTHLDRLPLLPPKICTSYQADKILRDIPVGQSTQLVSRSRAMFASVPNMEPEAFIDVVHRELGVETTVASYGPEAKDKQILREA